MSDEKFETFAEAELVEDGAEEGADSSGNSSSRARNQTVVLTPEMTGQVRAMLGKDDASGKDPLSELLMPVDWGRPKIGAKDAEAGSDQYGGDVPSQAALKGPSKTPTGKMRQQVSVKPSSSQTGSGAKQSGGGFVVNPAASKTPAAPTQTQAVAAAPAKTPQSKIIAFFVSFDTSEFGEVIEVRAGRWLVTSRPTGHGDYILINDDSISPLHAIVRASDNGKIQILDQLSEFGTGITRAGSKEEEEITGAMTTVGHGDTVRLGRRYFVVCTIPEASAVKQVK